jgi:hypothetical protein
MGYAGLLDLKQSRIHACGVGSAGAYQTLERVEFMRILLERCSVRISECAIDLHT